MGITKKETYTEKQIQLSALLKAMAHPARVAIIDYLLKTKSCICNDIVRELPLSQPTVSGHLKELKHAGIIKGEIEGNAICYCVDEKKIKIIQKYFSDLTSKISLTKTTCC